MPLSPATSAVSQIRKVSIGEGLDDDVDADNMDGDGGDGGRGQDDACNA